MENTKYVERWHSDAFKSRELAYQIFDDVKINLRLFLIHLLDGGHLQIKNSKLYQ